MSSNTRCTPRGPALISNSTALDAGEGRSIRIPNHLLLGEIVTVYGEADRREV